MLNANSADPDQTPRSAASDLGLHYLPMSHLQDARHKWFNSDSAPNYKHTLGLHRRPLLHPSSVKHHSETNIITNTMKKQNKGLNGGDMQPEYKT